MYQNTSSIFVYFSIVFIATSSFILSQTEDLGTISGRVSDSVTKERQPGVSLYLSGTKIGTSSDKNGNYKNGKIHADKYIVVVSMIGYKR